MLMVLKRGGSTETLPVTVEHSSVLQYLSEWMVCMQGLQLSCANEFQAILQTNVQASEDLDLHYVLALCREAFPTWLSG